MTDSKHTPTALPTLSAINWSCHAPTTIVGEINGKQVVFAECSGHGRYSIEDAESAAEIVRRCNSHVALRNSCAALVAENAALKRREEAALNIATARTEEHIQFQKQRDTLAAALEECAMRFESCCVHSGSDKEFAAHAVEDYRALVKATKVQP